MSATAAHRVRLVAASGREVEFPCPAGMAVFRAAELAGVRMRVGCMQGRCATCRCRVLEGAVISVREASRHAVGRPDAREDGHVLPCSVTPTCDTVLAVRSPWLDAGDE